MTSTNSKNNPEAILRFSDSWISVDKAMAKVLGVNEAALIQRLNFLLSINHGKADHTFNGQTWVYETYEDWQHELPWMKIGTIRNTIATLVSRGIIEKQEQHPHSWRRQLFYRIDHDCLCSIMSKAGYEQFTESNPSAKNWQLDESNFDNSSDQNSSTRDTKSCQLEGSNSISSYNRTEDSLLNTPFSILHDTEEVTIS